MPCSQQAAAGRAAEPDQRPQRLCKPEREMRATTSYPDCSCPPGWDGSLLGQSSSHHRLLGGSWDGGGLGEHRVSVQPAALEANAEQSSLASSSFAECEGSAPTTHTWERASSAGQLSPGVRSCSSGALGGSRLCTGAGASCSPAASAAAEGRMDQSRGICFYWECLLPATRMPAQQQRHRAGELVHHVRKRRHVRRGVHCPGICWAA